MDAQAALTNEDRRLLEKFATENGRTWKSKLRDAWDRGDAYDLHYLRNASYFGPRGLIAYRAGR
jgi:hypothetical protein